MNRSIFNILVGIACFMNLPQSVFAQRCTEYFYKMWTPAVVVNTATERTLLKTYEEVAKKTQLDVTSKTVFESAEFFNAGKIKFIQKHADTLLGLLRSGKISYPQLVKARLFVAEQVTPEFSKPHSYILIIDNNVISFDLKNLGYTILNRTQVGFRSTRVQFLRLSREFILSFDTHNNPKLYAAEVKDPASLEKIVQSGRLGKAFEDFYTEHKTEFLEILLSEANVSIQDLLSAPILKGTVESNQSDIYIVRLAGTIYYFSKTVNFGDHAKNKLWGKFETQLRVGFGFRQNDKITLQDGKTEFDVKGLALIPTAETLVTNSLLVLNQVLHNKNTSRYRSDFLNKYQSVLTSYIQKGLVSAENIPMHQLEVMTSVMNPSQRFYVLPAKNGFLYFAIDGALESGNLASINQNEYGSVFVTSNYRILEVKVDMGFTGKVDVEERMPGSPEVTLTAYNEKIKVALNLSEVSPAQSQILAGISRFLQEMNMDLNGLVHGQQAQQLIVVSQSIIDMMTKNNIFTQEQAEEYIKMMIAVPIDLKQLLKVSTESMNPEPKPSSTN